MTDSADGFSQPVEIMKTIVVAGEAWHILRPRRKDKQRAMGAGFEATAFGLPVSANGDILYMNHPQLLF